MEIEYDKDVDALYIRLREGSLGKNLKIDDRTILDLDKKGEILGIEILDASRRLSAESLSRVKTKNLPLLATATKSS